MKLGVLYSGGKDSNLAMLKAIEYGHEMECLIHLTSENPYSYMFHTPLQGLAQLQARAMKIPIIEQDTAGKKEQELSDLKNAISRAISSYGIEGIVTGAVRSVYQSGRIENVAHELGIWVFSPLWLSNEIEVLKQASGRMDAIIAGVAGYPLGQEWIGRHLDQAAIKELEKLSAGYGISPAGEGGEFETFVLDSELFRKRIGIEYHVEWDGMAGRIIPENAWLEEKS